MNAYSINHDDQALRDILDSVERQIKCDPDAMRLWPKGSKMHTRLIAPVQITDGIYLPMRWGYVRRGKAERFIKRDSALGDSVVFSQIALEQRCLIPASGYYEFVRQDKEVTDHHFKWWLGTAPLQGAWCWLRLKAWSRKPINTGCP